MKILQWFQNHHMEFQNFILIGLQKFIEKHTVFLHAMEFYLIMKVQEEVKLCYKKDNNVFAKRYLDLKKFYI